MSGNGPNPGDVAIVLRMMETFDLRLEDLVAGAVARVVPTFAEVDPLVREWVPGPSRRIYGTYWDRIVTWWGERRLDEPTVVEVQELIEHVRETAVVRRSSNGGKGAALHAYYALACVYRYAVEVDILTARQTLRRCHQAQ
ncbi:hypothetical protein ACFFQW_35185 [Umezawaea endophytica]|uniref:Uncharacterized protein n=1 Tax=Umezawaea endophytica TaxID=1654476 RepID=A0A9X2VX33_9PSEU|nr:hypothetical protein [Umezawaea endophytica]MCS7483714.1 hypothetical protein [Umezawaea endophytica]